MFILDRLLAGLFEISFSIIMMLLLKKWVRLGALQGCMANQKMKIRIIRGVLLRQLSSQFSLSWL